MAQRMRYKRKVTVAYGKARIYYEWIGFSDAAGGTNLVTTATRFGLVPPAPASGVIEPDITVQRVVGTLAVRNQTGVTTSTALSMAVHVVGVGSDQTIDDDYVPQHSDADALDHPVLWWWSAQNVTAAVAAADYDTTSLIIPVDIKVKRKLDKRDTLILTAVAGGANISRLSVNLRCLIRQY